MIECHLRSSECACTADQCVAAPPKQREPIGRLSPKEQVFVVIVAYTLLGSLSLWHADHVFKQEFQSDQELHRHG